VVPQQISALPTDRRGALTCPGVCRPVIGRGRDEQARRRRVSVSHPSRPYVDVRPAFVVRRSARRSTVIDVVGRRGRR